MNYLINPWIIYLIDKLDFISGLMCLFVGLSIIVGGIATLIYFESRLDDDEEKKVKNVIKKSIIVCIISLLFVAVLPSSETVTKMVVASYVTEDNVDKAKEEITEIVDYICDKVNEVKE